MNDLAGKSTTLAQQQRDLLSAIFTTKNIAAQAANILATTINTSKNNIKTRGLLTYQANAAASAVRSLQTAYPVIAQLLGEDAFEHLARDFWAQHPPTRGDLAQWGSELHAFMTSILALQTEPYLSDVARTEWALHTAAITADQVANVTTFALLTEHDPDALTLQLAPGTALIHSDYPVASILVAHLYANLPASPSFEEVGQKLRHNVAETALVWRQGLRPVVAICAVGEANFIRQLLSDKSLLAALEMPSACDSASDLACFDFNTWLPQAVQSGLLLGARLL